VRREPTRPIELVLRLAPVAALVMAMTGCGARAGYLGPPLYAWSDGYMENTDIYGPKICSAPVRFLKPTDSGSALRYNA